MNKPRWRRLLRLTHQRVNTFKMTYDIEEARDLWDMVKRFPLEARRQIFMTEEFKGAFAHKYGRDTKDNTAWLFLLPIRCRYMDKNEYIEDLIDGDPLLEVNRNTRIEALYPEYPIVKGKFRL